MDGTTIPHKIQRNGQRLATSPAYFERNEDGWQATSWSRYAGQVKRAAKALIALGMGEGEPVTILGFNRPEWVIMDTAAMTAGGVPAGIYATSSPDECAYILNHSEAEVILVENEEQWRKVVSKRSELPHLRWVVTMHGAAVTDAQTLSWDDFMARGGDIDDTVLRSRMDRLSPDRLGTMIYTSGTTGPPKAVMLSHDNLAWTAQQAADMVHMSPGDRVLSYLPLSHIAEQVFTIHGAATSGYAVYYARSIEQLRDDLQEVRPTIFFGVPRVWEKMAAGITEELGKASGVRARLASAAMKVARKATDHHNRGVTAPLVTRLQHGLFSKLVYSKVKAAIGLDDCRAAVSGAAPIAVEVLELFASFDLPIHEVYGQSEDTGPTSFNQPGRTRFGTVGPAYPGVEIRIADDGEVLVRGRNVFMGYYKDPEATAATLADGWLHSGDLGEFDDDDYLTITGRKKDIIITAGGKNVAPKLIEGGLKNDPLISEAVVIGDRRRYLTALIALDAEMAAKFLAAEGVDGPAHLAEPVLEAVQAAVDTVNGGLARVEQVKMFTILPRELSIAEGELTPTLKVKRSVVNQRFGDLIEAMYSSEE